MATKGHKCAGTTLTVTVRCECGWQSAGWMGRGARGNAYAEWRGHVEKFQCVSTTPPPAAPS